MNTQTAKLNYLKIAPRKVRLIANTLKGLPVKEAEAQLLMRIQRSSEPLLKLLRSAVANAKNNKKMDVSKLFISSIFVNPGPMLKRFMPRAQGRATPIHKKMSHVVLVLSEAENKYVERFVINPPAKKVQKSKHAKHPKAEEVKKESATGTKKPGLLKRMFRRTAV